MKNRNLFIGFMAFVFSLAACQQEDFGAVALEVDATSITVPLEGGSKSFTLKTTRDWTITVEAVGNGTTEGIVVSPSHGKPSGDAQTVTVSAEKNSGRNRQAVIVIKASTMTKEIPFSQSGELGNQMTIDEAASSAVDSPLTVKNALVYGVNDRGFVMGDDTGLILVYDGSGSKTSAVKVGDKVDVDGKVGEYGISQVIPTAVTVLSSGNDVPSLEPYVITKDNISMADRSMVNYVEMEGIYVKSGDYHNIKVIGSSVSGSISYPRESLGLADMEGEVVKVRGFYSGGTSEYYYNILVTEILSHNPLDAEARTIDYAHNAAKDELLKVQGTVMGVHSKGFVLGDDTGVIYLYTNAVPEVAVGNRAAVIGLKSVNYGVHQITPLRTVVDDPSTASPAYGTPVDLTTLTKLNAYAIDADRVAPDYVQVKGELDGLNVTYAAEDGVTQNKMPLLNYTIDSYDFLAGKEIIVTGYIVSYNSTKTPPTVGVLVVDVTAAGPYLLAEKDAVTVLPDAVTAEIALRSNVAWTATTDAEWLTVTPSGNGDGNVVLTFSEYTDTSADRTATVTITAEGVEDVIVTFTQMKAVEGGKLAQCIFTGWEFVGEDNKWDTSYKERIVEFEVATVTLASANKQTSTITDCPVTKGEDILIKMAEGKEMVSVTVYLKQWNGKAQTASLFASTDGGVTYVDDASGSSSDFTLSVTELPAGTDAAKVTFSSKDNQVGLEEIEIVYKDKE